MSIKEKEGVYVASARELANAPIIHAWSAKACEDPTCPVAHVFLFGKGDTLLAQLPLDEGSANTLVQDIYMALRGNKGVN
jgi:hypothetical protein